MKAISISKSTLILFAAVTLFYIFRQPATLYQHYLYTYVDQRAFLGIPNFFDVTSNIPFLLIGMWASFFVVSRRSQMTAQKSWLTPFIGVTLVAAGSTYYHLDPQPATLVWDRLPMTLGFMGLLSATLTEFVDERAEKALLVPLLLLGVASVFYWYNFNDVRLYLWVQFFPLGLLLLTLLLFRSEAAFKWMYFAAFSLYVVAKIAEHYDAKIYQFSSQIMSGHTAKHLLAAVAIYVLYVRLRRRAQMAGG